jgi:hypothetical protein
MYVYESYLKPQLREKYRKNEVSSKAIRSCMYIVANSLIILADEIPSLVVARYLPSTEFAVNKMKNLFVTADQRQSIPLSILNLLFNNYLPKAR